VDETVMNGEKLPMLTIIIVNFRTGGLVVDCLASLVSEIAAFPATRVRVVDNASNDDSANIIAAAIADHGWGDWAELICSANNGGFAYGNNIAIRAALGEEAPPDLFWLLNPDTRVYPGTLAIFLDFLRTTPKAGIVGSRLLDGNETCWPFAFRFPSVLSELERGACFGPVSKLLKSYKVPKAMGDIPEQVDWVSGASMMKAISFIMRKPISAERPVIMAGTAGIYLPQLYYISLARVRASPDHGWPASHATGSMRGGAILSSTMAKAMPYWRTWHGWPGTCFGADCVDFGRAEKPMYHFCCAIS
jgi:glycosyltransferase involved in cell wall biosynthesis